MGGTESRTRHQFKIVKKEKEKKGWLGRTQSGRIPGRGRSVRSYILTYLSVKEATFNCSGSSAESFTFCTGGTPSRAGGGGGGEGGEGEGGEGRGGEGGVKYAVYGTYHFL